MKVRPHGPPPRRWSKGPRRRECRARLCVSRPASHRYARSNIPRSPKTRATNFGSSPAQISDFQISDGIQPFAVRPDALAPAEPINDGPRVAVVVNRFKAAFAVLLDNEPHLLDSLADFGGFRSAAPLDPLRERPRRRRARRALAPRRDASAVASSPAATMSPSRCAARSICPSAPAGTSPRQNRDTSRADCLAVDIFGNEPPHEFRPSRSVGGSRRRS